MDLREQNKLILQRLNQNNPLSPPQSDIDSDNRPIQPKRGAVLDVAMAPFRGASEAFGGLWELADWATGDDLIPDWENPFGESETTAGSIVSGLVQFGTGFIPIFGALGKVGAIARGGKLAKTAQSVLAGAGTDFLAFDAQEERLSDLIQRFPTLQNPVTEFLAHKDEDDGEIEGRLKNTLEGLGAGAVVDATLKGLRFMKNVRGVRAAGDNPETLKKIAEAKAKFNISEEDFKQFYSSKIPEAAGETMEEALRHYNDVGELNTLTINGTAELTEFVYKAINKVREGGVTGKEKWYRDLEEQIGGSGKTLQDGVEERYLEMIGRDRAAMFDAFKGSTEALEKARYDQMVALHMMTTIGDQTREAAVKALADPNKKNLAIAAKLSEQFADLIAINQRFSKGFGQGLASRKAYFDLSNVHSAQALDELIEGLGGEKHLTKYLGQIAHATDSIKAATMTRKAVTKGGQLMKIHNEWFIQSILSGPKTQLVNFMSNVANTFFLPFERALGATAKGDLTTASSSLMQYAYMGSSFVDSFRSMLKAFKVEDNILLKQSSVRDVSQEVTSEALEQSVSGGPLKAFASKVWKWRPTNLLMTSDEFFKNINYRSATKVKLLNDARIHNKRVAAGEAEGLIENIPEYIEDRFKDLILENGEALSEAAMVRNAIAKHSDKRGAAKAQAISDETHMLMQSSEKTSALSGYIGSDDYMMDVSNFGKEGAEEATFTSEIKSKAGKDVQRFIRNHPLAQVFVPFFRTPANILKFVGQRTFPIVRLDDVDLPILNRLHRRAMDDLASGDPLKVASMEGRLMTGFGFFTMGAWLVDNGMITGAGPRNKEEKAQWREAGNQEYSITFDGGKTYYSYNRADPFGIFLGLVADWYEVSARSETHLQGPLTTVMASAATAIANNITNRSYLKGISNLVDFITEPTVGGPKLIESHLSALLSPNVIGSGVTPALDEEDAMYETRGLLDRTIARLPGGGDEFLEPVRNIMGERVFNHAKRGANWIFPFMQTEKTDDTVIEELSKVQHGFSKPSAVYYDQNLLDEAYRTEDGQSAYDRWLQLHGEVRVNGRTMRQALGRLFRSADYRKMVEIPEEITTTDPRVSAINRVVRQYRKAAMEQLEREMPQLKQAVSLNRLNRGRARSGLPVLDTLNNLSN